MKLVALQIPTGRLLVSLVGSLSGWQRRVGARIRCPSLRQAMLLCALFGNPATLASASENLPRFGLPIGCDLGLSCFVQNYMDHDKTDGARDLRCNKRTYNGHDGTDFRVPSMTAQKREVPVLSIADGVIKRVRDGIDDISIRVGGKDAIRGKECGNGAVVEHADGWSSQYCHLAKQSVRVSPGEHVTQGQPIGLVGLSGDTEFPHVHLTVRHNGEVIDPFAYGAAPDSCAGGQSLWNPSVAEATAYRETEVLNFGFAANAVTMDAIEMAAGLDPVNRDTPIVAYIRIIGLKAGDAQQLSIQSPDGGLFASHQAPPLESNKAQAFISVGRKTPTSAWTSGRYIAVYVLTRDGKEILRKTFELNLPSPAAR